MRVHAGILLTILILAGCATPLDEGTTAYDAVAEFVYLENGLLRNRLVEDPDHLDTADYLAGKATAGFVASQQRFTGQDYIDLNTAIQRQYSCPNERDAEQLPELQFANVYLDLDRGFERTLWLAAHWDAKEDTRDNRRGPIPGANDGASGVGLLLSLQPALAKLEVSYNLRIAFFDGEDGFEDCHPLAGSSYAARNLPDGEHRMILLDMVGDADAKFILESNSHDADPHGLAALFELGQASPIADAFTDQRRPIVDDHVPFIEAGVPAIDLIDAGRPTVFPPYWHTMDDDLEQLDADFLDAVGDILLELLVHQEYLGAWP